MGVNISVAKFISKEPDELWSGETVMYYKTETQKWFDSLRHSGDRDFIMNINFKAIDHDLPLPEQRLFRPKDFKTTREYVKSNVHECNQNRLLDALDKMELDESLCFIWSW